MGFFKRLKVGAGEQPSGGIGDALQQASQLMGAQRSSQEVLGTGIDGQATITSVAETNAYFGRSPIVRFELQVSVDGQPPYALTHTQPVSQLAIPRVQPGMTVPVKVDPNDGSKVALVL